MPISVGTNGIKRISVGNVPIKEVYVGSELAWKSGVKLTVDVASSDGGGCEISVWFEGCSEVIYFANSGSVNIPYGVAVEISGSFDDPDYYTDPVYINSLTEDTHIILPVLYNEPEYVTYGVSVPIPSYEFEYCDIGVVCKLNGEQKRLISRVWFDEAGTTAYLEDTCRMDEFESFVPEEAIRETYYWDQGELLDNRDTTTTFTGGPENYIAVFNN